MLFSDLVDRMNAICLDVFGESYALKRVASAPIGEEKTITGILTEGVQLEDQAPGDGSTYAVLTLLGEAVSPSPEKSDEITTATTVYTVVRVEKDRSRRTRMLLRVERAAA